MFAFFAAMQWCGIDDVFGDVDEGLQWFESVCEQV